MSVPASTIKLVTVRIFPLKPARNFTLRFHSPAGKVWKEGFEDQLLKDLTEKIEEQYPGVEFNLVEIATSKRIRQFNLCAVQPLKGDLHDE
jgi:hypothetical protein